MSILVLCANCGHQVMINEAGDKCYWCGKNASMKEPAPPGKPVETGQQKLETSKPRPESRRHMPLGRPRTGEWRKCKGCGIDIYISRSRIKKGKGKVFNCKKCYGLAFRTKKEETVPEPEAVSEEESTAEDAAASPEVYEAPEPKPGEFCILITEHDLARLKDFEFNQQWVLLGRIIQNRLKTT